MRLSTRLNDFDDDDNDDVNHCLDKQVVGSVFCEATRQNIGLLHNRSPSLTTVPDSIDNFVS